MTSTLGVEIRAYSVLAGLSLCAACGDAFESTNRNAAAPRLADAGLATDESRAVEVNASDATRERDAATDLDASPLADPAQPMDAAVVDAASEDLGGDAGGCGTRACQCTTLCRKVAAASCALDAPEQACVRQCLAPQALCEAEFEAVLACRAALAAEAFGCEFDTNMILGCGAEVDVYAACAFGP